MIRLLYNYYEDKNDMRKKEIDTCLRKNLANKHFTTVIIESQKRLTYNYFFDKIRDIADEADITIFCNSDIYFDESIQLVKHLKQNDVYALTRWDVNRHGHPIFLDRKDSQDTWIIRGIPKPVNGDFYLGYLGCDNRIAHEFQEAGYNVKNPSLSIKTYHLHNSAIRNYSLTDTVPKPYLTVNPSKL